MKPPVKIILAFLVTFLLAFATSGLFEFEFITKNVVRYILVIFLIIIQLLIGFFFIKDEAKKL